MSWIAYALFFVALVLVSRDNHPTLTLNLVASGIMTLASAMAFAVVGTLRTFSLVRLTGVVIGAGLAGVTAALVISEAYDVLRGPDPLRFSLTQNIVMDTAVVLAGWLWASVLTRLFR